VQADVCFIGADRRFVAVAGEGPRAVARRVLLDAMKPWGTRRALGAYAWYLILRELARRRLT
jgi:hypothetical protein